MSKFSNDIHFNFTASQSYTAVVSAVVSPSTSKILERGASSVFKIDTSLY